MTSIEGSVQYLEIPLNPRKYTATLRLNEVSGKLFSLDMRGYYGSQKINNGDLVSVLALKDDLQKNLKVIHAYQLLQGDKPIFTMTVYNDSLGESILVFRIFFWISIVFMALYLLVDKTNFIAWIKKQLNSPDPNFQPPNDKPNFNEFLDR